MKNKHVKYEKNILKKVVGTSLAAVLVTSALAGCADNRVEENATPDGSNVTSNSAEMAESTQTSDDSLSSLTGKKKSDEDNKVEIPEDYEYSLDAMGYLDIGTADAVIDDNYRNYYEIFVLSFYDSDGDGIGDINGVTEKLDYISEMGFNGIWLMPVMSSPSYHKYDTDDYYHIDPAYGTNEDFQRLLENAHNKGIKVVIDFVINHTSSEHPWFTQACDYLKRLPEGAEPDVSECPYIEYYHFTKEWSSGYCRVDGTDWYYEGVFNYTQPDLNYDSAAVNAEIMDVATYWTEMGVDGFRVDAAAHFEEGKTDYNKDVLTRLYNTCKAINPDFYMVSEVWLDEVTVANYYESMTPSFFNFDSANSEGKIIKTAKGSMTAEYFVESMLKYQEDYSAKNPEYIDAVFITNHDMTRVANQLTNDIDAMKMACGLMMSMQGSTFVYYGEEIGMKSSGSSDENKRIAMYWSDKIFVGMTEGPENAEKSIKSSFAAADEQAADPDSITNYYRRALLLRNNNKELARGVMTIVDELTAENVAAIVKSYEGNDILVIYNTSTEQTVLDLDGSVYADWEICGELTIHPWETIDKNASSMILPARSMVVLRAALF